MKIPGEHGLSNAEIIAFVDLAAADLYPGWKPSEHLDEHSLIDAYRAAQAGEDDLYQQLTTSRLFAQMVMISSELTQRYQDRPLGANVEAILGEGSRAAMHSILALRMVEIAKQVSEWTPHEQLGMFQLDGFLLGWLARDRYTSKDGDA